MVCFILKNLKMLLIHLKMNQKRQFNDTYLFDTNLIKIGDNNERFRLWIMIEGFATFKFTSL
jgi:hypothetical protein